MTNTSYEQNTAEARIIKTTGWHSNHCNRTGRFFTGIIMLDVIETEWREWAHKSFQSCGYPLQKEARLNLLMIYQIGYLGQTRQVC